MTRWKEGEKQFPVKLTSDHKGSTICRIPKPILDQLGSPSSIKFVISGKKIVVDVVDESKRRQSNK